MMISPSFIIAASNVDTSTTSSSSTNQTIFIFNGEQPDRPKRALESDEEECDREQSTNKRRRLTTTQSGDYTSSSSFESSYNFDTPMANSQGTELNISFLDFPYNINLPMANIQGTKPISSPEYHSYSDFPKSNQSGNYATFPFSFEVPFSPSGRMANDQRARTVSSPKSISFISVITCTGKTTTPVIPARAHHHSVRKCSPGVMNQPRRGQSVHNHSLTLTTSNSQPPNRLHPVWKYSPLSFSEEVQIVTGAEHPQDRLPTPHFGVIGDERHVTLPSFQSQFGHFVSHTAQTASGVGLGIVF